MDGLLAITLLFKKYSFHFLDFLQCASSIKMVQNRSVGGRGGGPGLV